MNLRKTVSLTALTSFLLLLVTSIVIYLAPQGRVAYWADWRLWGLSKTVWGNLHITVGTLFLLSILLHVCYNWNAILAYLKKSRRLRILTPEFGFALALTGLTAAGTWAEAPPFRWLIELNETLKERAARLHGEPPYGHAELSTLRSFFGKTNLEEAKALALLRAAGLRFEEQDTLLEVARKNGLSPRDVYRIVQPAEKKPAAAEASLPPLPPPGTGQKTIAALCERYGLEADRVIAALSGRGIRAGAGETVKAIASANGLTPDALYEIVREIAAAP